MTDEQWIASLVDAHESALCRYARSLSADEATALDAVQETFLRLCKTKRVKVEGHEAAWLFRVCRSRLVDMQRKSKPMQNLSIKQQAILAAPGLSPDAVLERRDSEGIVPALLKDLPDRQREAIRLKFQQSMSYREIADIMRISESNVGFLIHTGVKTLRDQMQKRHRHHGPVPSPTLLQTGKGALS
ncbi:MAG: sigma-70 family RNA polymerase sigma factor [Verrucomicrobia bacterium]|nr:sigma-70 family RNA polymerase sigma factor [Verrucomicrobiota bacterium]MCH8514076.1 sigma-70 family RNA polymerase sigma factor [Kiritimatiellia bacterium]